MKKNILLIVALLLISLTVKSQLHITPEAGISIFKGKDMKATISPRIGVGLDYFFAGDNGLGIGTGLYFYQKKETAYSGIVYTQNGEMLPLLFDEAIQRNDIDKLEFLHSDARRTYLQLPVLVKYKWSLANNLNLSLAAGPYFAYGISGSFKSNTQEYDAGEQKMSFVKDEFSPYDLYVYKRFEVGFTTMLSLDINHWIVKVNYETNLDRRNLNKDNLISLGLGYRFRL